MVKFREVYDMTDTFVYKEYRKVCNLIGATLLVFYALFFAKEYVGELLRLLLTDSVSARTLEVTLSLVDSILYFAAFTLPIGVFRLISVKTVSMPDMQLEPKLPKYLLLIIPASIAANFVLAYVNSMVMLPFNYDSIYELMTPTYDNGYYLYHFALDVFGTAIVPAVCEELLFRGLILACLLPYGKKTAVLGSAFMFAMMHQNFGQLIYTFGMGILLALIAIKTRSVFGGMILHFLNNLFSVITTSMYYIFPESRADFISNVMLLVAMAVGLACLAVIIFKLASNREGAGDTHTDDADDIGGVVNYSGTLSTRDALKGFFAPLNIVFICLALFQMVFLVVYAFFGGAV